jgi:hypothetical protein
MRFFGEGVMFFSSEADFMDSTDVYAEFGLADIYVQKNYLEGR